MTCACTFSQRGDIWTCSGVATRCFFHRTVNHTRQVHEADQNFTNRQPSSAVLVLRSLYGRAKSTGTHTLTVHRTRLYTCIQKSSNICARTYKKALQQNYKKNIIGVSYVLKAVRTGRIKLLSGGNWAVIPSIQRSKSNTCSAEKPVFPATNDRNLQVVTW